MRKKILGVKLLADEENMKINLFFYMAFALLCAVPALADEIVVKDGDSLEIGERRIRLDGIDAPEYPQICLNKEGKEYPCGKEALQFLENLTAGKDVDCRCLPHKDRYHREICECFAGDICINGAMISAGWAVAYRDKTYLSREKDAKENKRGIWQGKFMRPAIYRVLYREKFKTALESNPK